MPKRICCICRKAADKAELVRIVSKENAEARYQLVFDIRQTELGRGVYLHPEAACLFHKSVVALIKRSLFGHRRGNLDREQLREQRAELCCPTRAELKEAAEQAVERFKTSNSVAVKEGSKLQQRELIITKLARAIELEARPVKSPKNRIKL